MVLLELAQENYPANEWDLKRKKKTSKRILITEFKKLPEFLSDDALRFMKSLRERNIS